MKINAPDIGPVNQKYKFLLRRLTLLFCFGIGCIILGSFLRAAGLDTGIVARNPYDTSVQPYVTPGYIQTVLWLLGGWLAIPMMIGGVVSCAGSIGGTVAVLLADATTHGDFRR